ncbi:hypothetical protein F2Q70_00016984 [Brassica cretica]|uniref:Uncharacterized protein n=1 Tax=Brassica cretica TaxID=69181 RepID=A0A8S9I218_BRACR|nr:hypothetical protein F2Q70_00016984 [Brassica cretica]
MAKNGKIDGLSLPHIDVTEEGDGDEHQDHQHHEEQNNSEEAEAIEAGEQEQLAENNDANQDQHVTSIYGRNMRKPKQFDDYILLAEVEGVQSLFFGLLEDGSQTY